MTKKEKEILFKATQEAWNGTQLFKTDKDEPGHNIYKMYRSEFTTLSSLCNELGLREEYIKYAVQKQKEMLDN